MKFIDRIPLLVLIVLALWLGLAPLVPEPHLLEKARMLLQGTLVKPIDVFDLILHATPQVLLLVRLVRMFRQRQANRSQADEQR